jgi:carboxymethylenebutenolidase
MTVSDTSATSANFIPDVLQPQELTSADGTRFIAYAARSAQPSGAGIVVQPGGRGLLPIYTELADRFAAAGIDAVAIDHFGRTAGLGMRAEDFQFADHLSQTRPEHTAADVAAALRYLRSAEGGAVRAAFTIGFSFGGMASILQSVEAHGLAGSIGFYCWPVGSNDFPLWSESRPLSLVSQYRCPVLAIFGDAEERIASNDVQRFVETLQQVRQETGIKYEVLICPGAPHGFFDRRAAEFPQAAMAAWQGVLAFISAHTPPV